MPALNTFYFHCTAESGALLEPGSHLSVSASIDRIHYDETDADGVRPVIGTKRVKLPLDSTVGSFLLTDCMALINVANQRYSVRTPQSGHPIACTFSESEFALKAFTIKRTHFRLQRYNTSQHSESAVQIQKFELGENFSG